MTLRSEKILSEVLFTLGTLIGFEALVYILNINQASIYFNLSVILSVYVLFRITFYYDLHFKMGKKPECVHEFHDGPLELLSCDLLMIGEYAKGRFHHFRHWKTLRHWITCLGMPWLLYWATVAAIFLNFDRRAIQQAFVLFSTAALALTFWHLKEIYSNVGQKMNEVTHVTLQSIKLYAAFVIFIATLGLARYFCLPYSLYSLAVGLSVFTLMYQALFHMAEIKIKTVSFIFVISLILTLCAGLVFTYWGLNYFTAALFLMGLYNFFWGLYAYRLRGRLTWGIFWEYFLVTVFISALSIGTTNFRARILPYC